MTASLGSAPLPEPDFFWGQHGASASTQPRLDTDQGSNPVMVTMPNFFENKSPITAFPLQAATAVISDVADLWALA